MIYNWWSAIFIPFGKHNVVFVSAPMIHWLEAMVTYDTTNGVLFSADAFGSFISLDGRLFNDEVNLLFSI